MVVNGRLRCKVVIVDWRKMTDRQRWIADKDRVVKCTETSERHMGLMALKLPSSGSGRGAVFDLFAWTGDGVSLGDRLARAT